MSSHNYEVFTASDGMATLRVTEQYSVAKQDADNIIISHNSFDELEVKCIPCEKILICTGAYSIMLNDILEAVVRHVQEHH